VLNWKWREELAGEKDTACGSLFLEPSTLYLAGEAASGLGWGEVWFG